MAGLAVVGVGVVDADVGVVGAEIRSTWSDIGGGFSAGEGVVEFGAGEEAGDEEPGEKSEDDAGVTVDGALFGSSSRSCGRDMVGVE